MIYRLMIIKSQKNLFYTYYCDYNNIYLLEGRIIFLFYFYDN